MLSMPNESRDGIKQINYKCDLDQARRTSRRNRRTGKIRQVSRREHIMRRRKGNITNAIENFISCSQTNSEVYRFVQSSFEMG